MRPNQEKSRRTAYANRSRRGAAIVAALLASLALTLLAAYIFDQSLSSQRMVTLRESDAKSVAAAEYGARLAISEITSSMRREGGAAGDWIGGTDGSTLYVDDRGVTAKDQRRLRGFLGDREFRVLVRSAGLAKDNVTKPNSWLWKPGDDEALYEITAAARHRDEDRLKLGQEQRVQAAVRTVVGFNSKSGVGDEDNPAANRLELPGNFQPAMGPNIKISGEDHSINKYYIERFVVDRIITPLKLATSSANYFGARGNEADRMRCRQ